MMLPIVTTPVNAGTSDLSGSSSDLLSQDALPKDFVQLLAQRLPAKSATQTGQATASLSKDSQAQSLALLASDKADLSEQDLNTLLTQLDPQAQLGDASLTQLANALRKNAAQGDSNTADSSKETLAAQQQAVQALMAMLMPATATTPLTTDGNALLQQASALPLNGLNVSGQPEHDDASQLSLFTSASAAVTRGTTLATTATTGKESRAATAGDIRQELPLASNDAQTMDNTAAIAAQLASNSHANEGATQDTPPAAIPLHSAVNLTSTAQTALSHTIAQPSASAQLNAQLGSTQWQDSLGQQIIMLSRNGQQSVQLRLHPEELGTLHISLKLDDNQAQIHLASANSQVRSALEAALPHLRTAMAENGISLGQSSVGSDNAGWQQAQQQATNTSSGDSEASYRQQFAGSPSYSADPVETQVSAPAVVRSLNGVDIFA